jgi:hypothetical protein
VPSPAVQFEQIKALIPEPTKPTAPDLNCKNQGKGIACEPVGPVR